MKKRLALPLLCLLFLLFTGCASSALADRPADGALRALRAEQFDRFLFNSAQFISPDNLPAQRCVYADLDLDGEDELVSFLKLRRSGRDRVEIGVYKILDEHLSALDAIGNACDAVSDFRTARLSEDVEAMVIGWTLEGSESRGLSVCALRGGRLETLYGGYCGAFAIADFDGDGYDEILIARPESSGSRGSASLLDYTGDTLTPVSRVLLSQGLTAFQNVCAAPVGFEQTALILEGYIQDMGYVSDYIVCVDGKLINVFLSEYTEASTATLRQVPLWSADVDGNGYVELPVLRAVPNEGGADAPYLLWFVDWMQVGDAGMASLVCSTYHDFRNAWYMILPQNMENNLTVEISLDAADCMGVLFYYISDEGERTVPVWEIFVTRTQEARRRLEKLGFGELDAVYPCAYTLVHYRNVYGFSYSRRSLAAGFRAYGAPELPPGMESVFDFS